MDICDNQLKSEITEFVVEHRFSLILLHFNHGITFILSLVEELSSRKPDHIRGS